MLSLNLINVNGPSYIPIELNAKFKTYATDGKKINLTFVDILKF